MEIVLATLGSSVIAAVITSFFMIKAKDKDHRAKHIIEERQNWRKDIREKSVRFIDETDKKNKKKIMYELQLRLNPLSSDDNGIIESMKNILESEDQNNIDEEEEKFIKKIACLLKEDWERSKIEVKTGVGNVYKIICIIYILIIYYIIRRIEINYFNDTINLIIIVALCSLMLIYLGRFITNKFLSSEFENEKLRKLKGFIVNITNENYYRKG
ncbi:hypothetical protein [Clostridium sp. DL1XJH146]